jgi:hypothetical protein
LLGSFALLLPFIIVANDHLWRSEDGRPPEGSAKLASLPAQLATFNGLLEWVQTDCEITDPREDLFDHISIARRIAQRLDTSSLGEGIAAPTVAVVGALGSGKSTIFRLTKGEMERRCPFATTLMVNVSLWPFESPQAAMRGVLDALIRELGRQVSVLALAGLSGRYVNAVEKLGGHWAAAYALFQPSPGPEKILAELDDVALAANIRLVLWIEDLERFAGTSGDLAGEDREPDRLNPIRSLLYLLQRRKCVAVVVASTTLHTRFDLEKIARYVEEIPALDPEAVWRILHMFRTAWLARFGEAGYVDSAVNRAQSDLAKPELGPLRGQELISYVTGTTVARIADIAEALAHLCRTPRQLKQGLRQCLEVCENLKGEIDSDDVLAMSILREAEPDVFALVQEHIPDLRRGKGKGEKEDPIHVFEAYLERVLAKVDRVRHEAVNQVIDFVFPGRRGEAQHWRFKKPQGLGVLNEAQSNYWQRYLSLARPRGERADQEILRSIHGWQRGAASSLPGLLADSRERLRVRAFSWLLDEASLIRLLRAVVRECKSGGENHRILDDVWAIMIQRSPGGFHSRGELTKAVSDLLDDLLGKITPVGLGIADALVAPFANTTRGDWLLPAESSVPLLKQFYGALSSLPRGSLAAALAVDENWRLKDLVDRLVQVRNTAPGALVDEARAFRRHLLAEALARPEVLLPRIAVSCVMLLPEPPTRYVFDEALARKLFDVDELRSLFANAPPSFVGVKPDLLGVYQIVRAGLTKAPSPSPAPPTGGRP